MLYLSTGLPVKMNLYFVQSIFIPERIIVLLLLIFQQKNL